MRARSYGGPWDQIMSTQHDNDEDDMPKRKQPRCPIETLRFLSSPDLMQAYLAQLERDITTLRVINSKRRDI